MRWCVILIGAGLALGGCGGVKKLEAYQREEVRKSRTEESSRVDRGEKVVVCDTVVMVRAPVENSSSTGSDSSWLQTSLAWSAAVWREGELRHTIGNFPQVALPARVEYRDRWLIRRDTLLLRDSLQQATAVYRERKQGSGWDRLWAAAGKIMLVGIAGWLAWRKWKPR